MNKANLILHCGAAAVDREQLALVPTPALTDTWTPIPHASLLTQVERALGGSNFEVVSEAHGLSKDGARYFGLLQVARVAHFIDDESNPEFVDEASIQTTPEDYGYVIGVRNSHDKRFPAGLAVGSSVFVCDNLSFYGEISVARKHTVFIERDLPALTARAIGDLSAKWNDQGVRFEAYKQHTLRHAKAHDLLIKALDCRAVTTTQIPHILKEWRTPRHPEFAENGLTAWRFWNACTEVGKDSGVWQLPDRTRALHGILDQEVGIFGQN